jgi:hypothetical protein
MVGDQEIQFPLGRHPAGNVLGSITGAEVNVHARGAGYGGAGVLVEHESAKRRPTSDDTLLPNDGHARPDVCK